MKNNMFKTLLLLTLVSLNLQPSFAQENILEIPDETKERWFQVEVIVFQHTALKDLRAEDWPEQTVHIDYSEVVDFLSPLPRIINKRGSRESIPENLSPETEIPSKSINPLSFKLKRSELPFIPLNKSFNQMNEQLASIKRSRKYRLLRHMVWRQPGESKSKAAAVRILGGDDFAKTFHADGEKIQAAVFSPLQNRFKEYSTDSLNTYSTGAQRLNTDDYFNALPEQNKLRPPYNTGLEKFAKIQPHVWELDGFIKIHLRRYLHINLDLKIKQIQDKFIIAEQFNSFVETETFLETEPEDSGISINWNEAGATEDSENSFINEENLVEETIKVEYLQPYQLLQKRRVRSKEVHYFDHPVLGVMVLITPYDNKPEPAQEESEE